MELAIPGVAIGLMYIVSKQKNETKHKENFKNLPNTNIPDKNYPSRTDIDQSAELDNTSKLTRLNRFDNNGVYTDKYFNQKLNKTEQDNNLIQPLEFTSLTGEKVNQDYFQHNNMVPYFGGNHRTVQTTANSNEGIIDRYSGSGSQNIAKSEQSPLFKPDENMQYAHGTPNQSDFIQSRINPSMRMNNVNPFEEEKVGPGLGLGTAPHGANGFNSGMMMRDELMPKNVDELRTLNNPKSGGTSLIGLEGAAVSNIKNITTTNHLGVIEKNRPDTDFEFTQDRYLTTTGAVKGNTLHSIPIDRYVNRPETTTSYTGNARAEQGSSYVAGEYMPSHNQQLGPTPLGIVNANNKQRSTEADYGIKSNTVYPNNRSSNIQTGYFGSIKNSVGAAIAPMLDILRPSRKENVIGTLRPYQNATANVPNSYIYNPDDRPSATIRETTEKSKNHLNVNANQNGGAYQVTDHQVSYTTRNETGDYFYTGGMGATDGHRELKSYDSIKNQRNNDIKTSTINGRLTKGNMSLMSGDIKMRQKHKENDFTNKRDIVGTMPYQSPDTANMGILAGHNNTQSTIHADRNNLDISSQLQKNPYIVNYKNGL